VEYSPAKEQVEMVATEPVAGMVTVPKLEVKRHWLWVAYPVNSSNGNNKKYNFFINSWFV
jgi:hypothetical protein